jgi:hypothetical protein
VVVVEAHQTGGKVLSFAQVVRSWVAPVVMVPPRPTRGWGRDGFRAGRGGHGVGRFGRRRMVWYKTDRAGGRGQGELDLHQADQGRTDPRVEETLAIEVEAKNQDLNQGSSSSDQQGMILPNPAPAVSDKGKAMEVAETGLVKNIVSKGEVGKSGPDLRGSSSENPWDVEAARMNPSAEAAKKNPSIETQQQEKPVDMLICFRCKEPGHMAYECKLRWPVVKRGIHNLEHGDSGEDLSECIAYLCAT